MRHRPRSPPRKVKVAVQTSSKLSRCPGIIVAIAAVVAAGCGSPSLRNTAPASRPAAYGPASVQSSQYTIRAIYVGDRARVRSSAFSGWLTGTVETIDPTSMTIRAGGAAEPTPVEIRFVQRAEVVDRGSPRKSAVLQSAGLGVLAGGLLGLALIPNGDGTDNPPAASLGLGAAVGLVGGLVVGIIRGPQTRWARVDVAAWRRTLAASEHP